MNNLTPAPYSRMPYDSDATYPMADVGHLVTIRDLLRVLRVRWRAILAAAAATALLAMVTVSLITPTYMGAALVMVDEQQHHVVNEQADPSVLSDLPSDPSSIDSQVQMLQSHTLAGHVADKLKLVNDPEFNGARPALTDRIFGFIPRFIASRLGGTPRPLDAAIAAQTLRERTISKFRGGLDVHAVGLSTVIEVDFRSTSAEKAARIANAVAETYIENLKAAKSNATEGASKWLADRVIQLGRQAGTADAAVQQYKADNGLVDTSNGTAMTDQQLGALTAQLVQAQGDQAQAQAKLARVQQMIKSGHSADVSDVVGSPLIAQLREQEATILQQKADLASRYGPLYPAMKTVQARIDELEWKISDEVKRIVGTASNDAAVAAARVGAVKSNVAAATSNTAVQNRARIKLGELMANASSAHALYQSYLDRLKQTQQRASLNTPDVLLASPAPVPLGPVAPKKLVIVGGLTLVSLVLGFLAALVADRMCNGFRAAAELEAALDLPTLATVPEGKSRSGRRNSPAMEILRKPHSQFSEAIRGLEIGLSLQLGRPAGGEPATGKVVLVTSALPAEGKTSIAVNLARRLAISGHRVVIVDADQRRPMVAAMLGLRMVRNSLTDYLARHCSLEQVLVNDPHSPVVVLPGAPGKGDVDLNGSREMAFLIGRLRQIADYVVIDSPPLLAVHDAKLLAQMTDGTVFVVRWGKTSREAVTMAVKLLREFRVKLTGTVLVRANAKQYQYYAFGYAGAPTLSRYYESGGA